MPEDISVIGFDDISMSKMFIPPLTTIRQSITEKGAIAAEHLINMIQGGGEQEANEIMLPLTIMERATVKTKDNPQAEKENDMVGQKRLSKVAFLLDSYSPA